MLNQILETKKAECKTLVMPDETANISRKSLKKALLHSNRRLGIIAEIKKASPSKGLFKEQVDAGAVAREYAEAGADAISVLTDRIYFQGSNENLIKAKLAVDLPVLRKDFIIDKRQLEESRLIGADAVLLIAGALPAKKLYEFYVEACHLGLEVLVEVHDENELTAVLNEFKPEIIGINNRNLKTFETNIQNTMQLLPMIPNDIVIVSESGIKSANDIDLLISRQVNGALVGEALMTAPAPKEGLACLFGEGMA
ncbi:indole-3-glycerol phosphate synthase [Scopulibacillus daqui]|uniref:Indole-3-glycerol phosphate synthase n=1 Tax=Scopulibacillus daqui TaxID=1469162 RepID=A0ABS2PZ32_9BACL|nr:indole-3-glycerol phosphate synthase TrpC [Scopulibacillus daqui]MBM7645287.1 indole-3-glycerol phosphate synthase [Scopulibacillus daqui]